MENVIALSTIHKKVNVIKRMLQSYSFSLSWFEQYNTFFSKEADLADLEHLVTCRVIPKGMSEKIVKTGLCYQHLQL